MKEIRERKNIFLERWSRAEYINSKMGVLILVQLVLIIILSSMIFFMSMKPKSIYYISPDGSGIIKNEGLPDNAVGLFAQSWLVSWLNFTPVTVKHVYDNAVQFMSPHLLARMQQHIKSDIEQTIDNKISSQFSISKDVRVERFGDGFIVTILGDKNIYIGNQDVVLKRIVFSVTLRKVRPTDSNIYGLVIDELEEEVQQ